MQTAAPLPKFPDSVIVVGAGIGGLAAALRLAHAGSDVTVIDRASAPGGKIRTVPTDAGPTDAGPTVLTLRSVFDALFADVGARLEDHVTLTPLPVLARHFWTGGPVLDLTPDPRETARAIAEAFGAGPARDYTAHAARAERLFAAFDGPMMRTAAPSQAAMTGAVAGRPFLVADMAPHRTLQAQLDRQFRDPRLAQLFARYATYVGGMPDAVPAILNLISHAEAAGVWAVEGGLWKLPLAIAEIAGHRGVRFLYDTHVQSLSRQADGWTVHTASGVHTARTVVFNGDPRALRAGYLGPDVASAVPATATEPRSLSAVVASFAARVRGPVLSHHNVFFSDVPNAEFGPIARGNLPRDATLYVCAQDAGTPGLQRYEIILNAPAGLSLSREETQSCLTHILDRLKRFGVTFDPPPTVADLTTPQDFDRLYPGSMGALYGRSPAGLMAAFKRPTARTALPGLYLAGGGAHPGAGVPMATLSGRHAAEAIIADRALTSGSARMATPGGISTGSATTARAPSRSSAS